MKKRLFDDKDRYDDDAREFDLELNEACRGLLAEWISRGYCIRDIEYLANRVVTDICVMAILDQREDVDGH